MKVLGILLIIIAFVSAVYLAILFTALFIVRRFSDFIVNSDLSEDDKAMLLHGLGGVLTHIKEEV